MSRPSVSGIRWVAAVPGVTGLLELWRDPATGQPLEFTAPDKAEAMREAKRRNVPPAAMIVSRLAYEELRRVPAYPKYGGHRG